MTHSRVRAIGPLVVLTHTEYTTMTKLDLTGAMRAVIIVALLTYALALGLALAMAWTFVRLILAAVL